MHYFRLVETSVLGERKLSRYAPIDILERNNPVIVKSRYNPLAVFRILPLGIELNGFHGEFLLVEWWETDFSRSPVRFLHFLERTPVVHPDRHIAYYFATYRLLPGRPSVPVVMIGLNDVFPDVPSELLIRERLERPERFPRRHYRLIGCRHGGFLSLIYLPYPYII